MSEFRVRERIAIVHDGKIVHDVSVSRDFRTKGVAGIVGDNQQGVAQYSNGGGLYAEFKLCFSHRGYRQRQGIPQAGSALNRGHFPSERHPERPHCALRDIAWPVPHDHFSHIESLGTTSH